MALAKLTILLLVYHVLISPSQQARILAVFPLQARSHFIVFEPLLNDLARRGHELHIITHHPRDSSTSNVTYCGLKSLGNFTNAVSMNAMKAISENKISVLEVTGVQKCEKVLLEPCIQNIIKLKQRFDIFINELLPTDCFLGLAHNLNIYNVIGVSSSILLPWFYDILRNPDDPSYLPSYFTTFSSSMTLTQRLVNTWSYMSDRVNYKIYSLWPSYTVAKRILGKSLPNFDVLKARYSLYLLNTHLTITESRPLVPAIKEIGGIHLPSDGPEPLIGELADYIGDAGKNGLIYFSFGTYMNTSTMRPDRLKIVLRALAKTGYRVLWKSNIAKTSDLPDNIRTDEWLPQLAVLCHPNTKLFISHGGMLSMQEAIYCGVPILALPLFSDQPLNAAVAVRKGYALKLDFWRMTEEEFSNTIQRLLTDERFVKAVKRVSQMFRDRPIPPLEEASYWVEYVLRFGPDSLKTFATNLAWYEYFMLDIGFTILSVIFGFYWLFDKFGCFAHRRVARKSSVCLVKKSD